MLDQVKAIGRNSDYEVIVFRPCRLFEHQKSYEIDGVRVHHVPSWFMPSYFFNGFGGSINGRNLIKKLRILNISINEIAVCHCHTAAFACFATALKRQNQGIKTVLQYHDPDPYQIRLGRLAGWRPNITYRAKNFIKQFKYIDLHLCISKKTKYNLEHFPNPHPEEYYESYLKTLKRASHIETPHGMNTYVLYNGVDTSVFHALQIQKDKKVFKIGCVANFNTWKGHITLIRTIESIIKEMSGVRLLVSFVGSGETKAYCKNYIDSHGLSEFFSFESEVSHNQLAEYYNTLDLFVLPSYFEGFGCVFTEAAACGVSFMGCYHQGYSEYIPESDKEKWLIVPHDYQQLARLIKRQMTQPIKQRLAYPYDINVLIKSYLDYLTNL